MLNGFLQYVWQFSDKKEKVSEEIDKRGCVNDLIDKELKDSTARSCSKDEDSNEGSSSNSHVDLHPVLKKKKLHWG